MNVVVTGASRGIGFELVKLFLSKGHKVLAISRNKSQLQLLKEEGANVLSFDLSERDFAPICSELASFGMIDVLVNNAGTLINKPFSQLSDNDIKNVFEVNVFSVFRLIREMLPFFCDNAHIINVSSIGGVQGSIKFPGLSAYSSSKGALSILTECLAEEYKATNLRFNALALGAVQTEMLQAAFPDYQAKVTPSQMAKYIFNFAVEDGKLFNGKILQVSSSTP